LEIRGIKIRPGGDDRAVVGGRRLVEPFGATRNGAIAALHEPLDSSAIERLMRLALVPVANRLNATHFQLGTLVSRREQWSRSMRTKTKSRLTPAFCCETKNYFFISSVLVVVVLSAGAGAGGVASAGAGAGAGAGGVASAGAGAGVVVVVLVVEVDSSFFPQAVSEIANNDATSRVFFIVPSLGE
jgi:hypothetical protein